MAGETSARPWAGGPKPKPAAHDEALRVRVISKPGAAFAEPQAWLMTEHGLKVSIGCLWKRLQQLQACQSQSRWRQRSDRAGWRNASLVPAYSPDLNPIEQAFAKLKAAPRKAAARTFGTSLRR